MTALNKPGHGCYVDSVGLRGTAAHHGPIHDHESVGQDWRLLDALTPDGIAVEQHAGSKHREAVAAPVGVSDGMVLLPRDPTEAMLDAGRSAVMARDCSSPNWGPADHYRAAGISREGIPARLFEGKGKMSKAWGAELVYCAMLAAAPSAPQEKKACTRNCDCVGPCKMGDE